MDDQAREAPHLRRVAGGFSFTGDWKEFLPIALTNLLLTIVTLGIYRFWAKARERRYLWSRTHFIDDSFEWTGTGLEMLIGFVIVMAVLLPAVLFVQFGLEALLLRGEALLATVVAIVFYFGIFYLINVAMFRALRYRLSRTYWHGIRGGSDDGGWHYGWSGIWRNLVGWIALGLLIPWAMTSLWNERWNKMSYGPYPFEANAEPVGLMGRWLLVYLAPAIGFVLVMDVFGGMMLQGAIGGQQQPSGGWIAAFVGVFVIVYLVFLLFSLAYYAAYYRHVAAATRLGSLRFEFRARTMDWLMLILGNIGLVIVTLGIGLLFLSYRNWKFVIAHLGAEGEVDLEALTQSATAAPGEAEGLADAFDIGAI
jgi:uncharacterized membrane protein YjgN (DUF898 family)